MNRRFITVSQKSLKQTFKTRFWLQYNLLNICSCVVNFILFCTYTEKFKLDNKNLSHQLFDFKITFWICVLVLWIHKGYFVVKRLVYFWYSKQNKISQKFSCILTFLNATNHTTHNNRCRDIERGLNPLHQW